MTIIKHGDTQHKENNEDEGNKPGQEDDRINDVAIINHEDEHKNTMTTIVCDGDDEITDNIIDSDDE